MGSVQARGRAAVPRRSDQARAQRPRLCFSRVHQLERVELPSTAKGAEILAIDFGIKRFEETKDENGDRDTTRISENNAACVGGKCTKDTLLPDELLS